jgi:hypothetical protein
MDAGYIESKFESGAGRMITASISDYDFVRKGHLPFHSARCPSASLAGDCGPWGLRFIER